jgi:hypothetical protein
VEAVRLSAQAHKPRRDPGRYQGGDRPLIYLAIRVGAVVDSGLPWVAMDDPLRFGRGHCGPYAETLTHVLNTLEGHYLAGYGDHTSRVTELVPITPTAGSLDEAESIVHAHPDDAARIDRLLELIDGFETPYSLELLATVHFAAAQRPASTDPNILVDRGTSWNLRKARLFTNEHVRIAAQRLAERELLPV